MKPPPRNRFCSQHDGWIIVVDILEMGMFISNYFNTMFSLWWDASLSLSLSVSRWRAWGAWDASGMIWIDMMGCLILEWCGMMGHWPILLSIHLRWTQGESFCCHMSRSSKLFLTRDFSTKNTTEVTHHTKTHRVNHVELNIRLQCNTKEIPAREHDQAREYSTLTIHIINHQTPTLSRSPRPTPKKKVHYQSSKTYNKQTSNCQQPPRQKQIKPAMLFACQVSVPASRSNLPPPSAARQSSLKDRNGCTSQCPGTLATSIILWSLPPIKACHAVERALI